jgi:hypothetical protein
VVDRGAGRVVAVSRYNCPAVLRRDIGGELGRLNLDCERLILLAGRLAALDRDPDTSVVETGLRGAWRGMVLHARPTQTLDRLTHLVMREMSSRWRRSADITHLTRFLTTRALYVAIGL